VICDELAERIGASRKVIEGAGHEIQFTGEPVNDALLTLWGGQCAGWSGQSLMHGGAPTGHS
jgi:hypothetical protein